MAGGIRPIGGGAIGSGSGVQSTFVVPISDILRGGWAPSLGNSLFAAINEDTPDDSDTILSSLNPTNDVSEVGLDATADPGVDFGHVLKYRFRKLGPGNADIIMKLKQGATVIATFTHNDISSSYTLAEQVISDSDAADITNYSNLRVEITANKA